MIGLFFYSLAFSVFSTVILAYFAWKIMRMHVTPAWTWSLFFAAMMIQIARTIWGLAYLPQIQSFMTQIEEWVLLASYGLQALQVALIFAFVMRIYTELRAKFPSDLPKQS